MRGGTYLAMRQAISLLIHLGGVLLMTRTIGPQAYGIYAAALGLYTYLFLVSQLGLSVSLIRREAEVTTQEYDQAFSLLLVLGAAGVSVALLGLPLAYGWIRLAGLLPIARAMFLVLPVQLLALVPLARLERALDYRRVAMAELMGYVAYYVVALPLAFRGLGPWAPVAGYWTQQATVSTLLFRSARYQPRFYWDRALARQMIGYGLGYSSATWIWQLRDLVNPLVVGRYAGASAVGYVALAVRLVDALSFIKTAAWRLSIAVFARLQTDSVRLLSAIGEGMQLQILALGPILVVFGLAAPWIIAGLFGDKWVPMITLYPFIALSYLTNAVFNFHSSTLLVLRRTWQVAAFHLAHLTLFAGSALVLVPRIGLVGYGWAEVVALLSYGVLHAHVARYVGMPSYGFVGRWWIAWVLPLFWQRLGWWSLLGPAMALAWPGTGRQLKQHFVSVTGLLHAR